MTGQQIPTPPQDRASIPQQRRGEHETGAATGAQTGWIRFGGVVMAVIGAFAVIEGILALALPTTYVSADGTILAIDFSGWGWIHLVLGVLVLATGLSLLGREVPNWARGAGIGLVAVNMLVQLAWMPAYPIWSIILLALDVFVLYALIVTWGDTQL
ncbi:MAG: Integral rane protein [Actinomycetospora sp.]|jgi:hypothetical protein|nr:Integral rane protein [Actinomycetospora sp.]